MNKTLADRLRRRRRECGVTQAQLAAKACTSQGVIAKIENGKSKLPRIIEEIAKVLGVNPGWLMFGPKSAPKIVPESPFPED
jgi:transcriptional regulator with XRE-family HTH domain